MDEPQLKLLSVIFQFILGGFCTLLWFNFLEVKKKGEENIKDLMALRTELADHRRYAAETFVTENNLERTLERFAKSLEKMDLKLDHIDTKLDRKQDKS